VKPNNVKEKFVSDFFFSGKSHNIYIDKAINGNGQEKSAFTLEAMNRLKIRAKTDQRIIEIGPGGGTSVNIISDSFEDGSQDGVNLHMSFLELEGVESEGLKRAQERLAKFATSDFINGDVKDLESIYPDGSDIVVASAVLHEVYSYGGGYEALDTTFGQITNTLNPGGFFAYRDIFSVDRLSQHERTRHVYDREAWVRFTKLFLTHYLENATHPYHRQDDRIIFEQNSTRVGLDDIDMTKDLSVDAPIGLLREIQRHYITLRDHVWRQGSLGITPVLEGDGANDWVDIKRGYKRVHFTSTLDDPLLDSISEGSTNGCRVVDGDIFDSTTEVLLGSFFKKISVGDESAKCIWEDWLKRESSETYIYMTLNELIGTVAVQSFAASEGSKILLPTKSEDVAVVPRSYYNRFLRGQLSNPLPDGKQMVLFEVVDTLDQGLSNGRKVAEALDTVSNHCSKKVLSEIYDPVRRVF
jgi:hypothetical protein